MSPPRRIALLKPSALGDIVHTLPVLTALRRTYPTAHITWVVNRVYEPMLRGHPHLDATLPFDRGAFKSIAGAVTYPFQFGNLLRRKRFDLVVDLQGLLRTGLMCAMSGAPRKVGFASAREGSVRFYTETVAVPDADRIHAVDRYWRMAEYLGAGAGPKEFHVPIAAEERSAAQAELAALPRPWIAVAVGSRWRTKQWPPAHFAELVNRALTQFGGSAILLGVPDDRALSTETAQQIRGPVLDLTGKTSLPRLGALLAEADVMIANDTGPLHLAAALGTPCIAPYTCTRIVLHGPYGSFPGAVETTVPCAGSYLRQCPHGLRCMTELSPDRLWAPLSGVLTSWRDG